MRHYLLSWEVSNSNKIARKRPACTPIYPPLLVAKILNPIGICERDPNWSLLFILKAAISFYLILWYNHRLDISGLWIQFMLKLHTIVGQVWKINYLPNESAAACSHLICWAYIIRFNFILLASLGMALGMDWAAVTVSCRLWRRCLCRFCWFPNSLKSRPTSLKSWPPCWKSRK